MNGVIMYSVCKKSLFAFLFLSYALLSGAYAADDSKLSQSNKVFDLAEAEYPEYFSPSGMETFELDDYWVRYYSITDIYIGTLADEVYVYGTVFNGLLYVGEISEFVTLGKCTDNFPKPACDGNNNVGAGARFRFASGQSCSNAFPEYEYDPSLSEGTEGVCGFIECGACAGDW